MNTELQEIFTGLKRAILLITLKERLILLMATVLMLVNGVLTNLPAVMLGGLVDTLTKTQVVNFTDALPFLGLIIVIILIKEAFNVIRKYLVQMVATQTDKKQTISTIDHLLKTDLRVLGSF